MIIFQTKIEKGIFCRPRLVLYSTHEVKNGRLRNMFEGSGAPMLDVADALELKGILSKFIDENT